MPETGPHGGTCRAALFDTAREPRITTEQLTKNFFEDGFLLKELNFIGADLLSGLIQTTRKRTASAPAAGAAPKPYGVAMQTRDDLKNGLVKSLTVPGGELFDRATKLLVLEFQPTPYEIIDFFDEFGSEALRVLLRRRPDQKILPAS